MQPKLHHAGGSSTAFFLAPKASLYLFYSGEKYLDWDVWNNVGDIRVHWLRAKDRDEPSSLETLTNLVSSELDHLDLQHQELIGLVPENEEVNGSSDNNELSL